MANKLIHLSATYGSPCVAHVSLPSGAFEPLSSGRTREVAFAVRRPGGQILLHTKSIYPKGTFRIPTGGIEEDEDIEAALLREVEEEMGLDVQIERFFALVDYRTPELAEAFTTYAFILKEMGGVLSLSNEEEKISGWREVLPSALTQVASELESMEGDWHAWGLFRAPVHRILAQVLASDAMAGPSDGVCGEGACSAP